MEALMDFPVSRSGAPNVAAQAADRSLATRCLQAMIDEVDYPMLLVRDEQVEHLNRSAVAVLHRDGPLSMEHGRLTTARLQDRPALAAALLAACYRGLRTLVTLGDRAGALSTVAVLPIGHGPGHDVMLIFGRPDVCEPLSVQAFARCTRLTAAETEVLHRLTDGLSPQEIAVDLGVEISTVRTQISSIRSKTQARSMIGLVRQMARLPPLMPVLHASSAA